MIIDLIFTLLTVGLLIGTLYFKTSRRRPHGSLSATPGLQNIVSARLVLCDHPILLIMTGNAYKESCHKLSSKLLRNVKVEGGIETQSKLMVGAFKI